MRVLVVGAGAIGGYFGARLLAAGRDVTFLVRAARAERLTAAGLVVKSPKGDLAIPNPPTVQAGTVAGPFGLVVLSCKAYDLDGAMDSLAPAVGPETAILPLLNGLSHLDALDARFGAETVLGGQCQIAATLDPAGAILHLNDLHALTYGERDASRTPRIAAIEAVMNDAGFAAGASRQILLEMWEKWVFLASLAAATSLMRAPLGDIVAAPGGGDFMLGLVAEAAAVATACGSPPRAATLERLRGVLTAQGSPMTASMARDIANGARIEADHVVGDLIGRGRERGVDTPRFETAFIHLKAYEAGRERQAAAG